MMFFGKVFIPALDEAGCAVESAMVSTLELVTQATYKPDDSFFSHASTECDPVAGPVNPQPLKADEKMIETQFCTTHP